VSAAVQSPKRVQNVFVVAKQPASLHAFYEGALGLPMTFRDGDRWIQYGVGGTNVGGGGGGGGGGAPPGRGGVLVVVVFDVCLFII
jgi:hypothetical protein